MGRSWIGNGVAALLPGSFLLLTALVVAGLTQAFDDAWNSAMAEMESPLVVGIAELFNRVGAVSIALPIAVAVAIWFLVARRWRVAAAWVTMVVVAQILSSLTKVLVGRGRPQDALVSASFAA